MFELTHKLSGQSNFTYEATYLYPDHKILARSGYDKWQLGTVTIPAVGHGDCWMKIDLIRKSMTFYSDKRILDSICDKFLSFKERLCRYYHIKFLPIRSDGSQEKIIEWVPYPGKKGVLTTKLKTEWKVSTSQFEHYKKAKYYDKIALLRKAICDKSYEHVNFHIKTRKILATFDVPTLYKVRCVNKTFRDLIDKNYLPSKVEEVKDILDCQKAVEKTSYSDYLGDTTPLNATKRVVIAAAKIAITLACPAVIFTGISVAIPMMSLPLFASISIGGGLLTGSLSAGTLIISFGKSGQEFRKIKRDISNGNIQEQLECNVSKDASDMLKDKRVFGTGSDEFCAAANPSYVKWKAKKIAENFNQEEPDLDNEDLKCAITWNTMRIPAYVHHPKSAWDYEALKETIKHDERDPNREDASLEDIKLNVEKFNQLQLLRLGYAI